MKVSDVKALSGAPRAKTVEGVTGDETTVPKDRVSVQETRDVEAAVAAAHRAAGGRRGARAEKLEAEVRAGTYRPDAGRVAEQILADAEIDARIASLLRH
ncbi:MAG: flagellar biosynthesis anti-sigma factor FlgM [Deltaproteobacteria bacterium]|nr:flagellar biosynthesis anti-sigma factor FlgM [Deltaproteobacteria bacterium]